MRFDTPVLQAFGRLAGIGAFLEMLGRALPEPEWSDNEVLKERAEDEELKFADLMLEVRGTWPLIHF